MVDSHPRDLIYDIQCFTLCFANGYGSKPPEKKIRCKQKCPSKQWLDFLVNLRVMLQETLVFRCVYLENGWKWPNMGVSSKSFIQIRELTISFDIILGGSRCQPHIAGTSMGPARWAILGTWHRSRVSPSKSHGGSPNHGEFNTKNWLVVWNIWIIFHFIYGLSSFPLTNSIIFQDGLFNHQPENEW